MRERLLAQLDFALALMMRQLPGLVAQRAEVMQCRDLLNEAIYSLALVEGARAARWIRRHQRLAPDEYAGPEVIDPSDSSQLFKFA